jgi:hypothetical protein
MQVCAQLSGAVVALAALQTIDNMTVDDPGQKALITVLTWAAVQAAVSCCGASQWLVTM